MLYSEYLLRRKTIELILIRHGETQWNNQRRIQGGSSDIELNETGRNQAEKLGLSLKEREINAIYSSPLKRARDTAQAVASHHNLEMHIEPGLRELEVGELEGVTAESLGTDFSNFLIHWQNGNGAEKLPGGGESLIDLQNRAWSVVKQIVDNNQGAAAVVTHYFVILAVISAALELPLPSIRRFRVQVSSISILDFNNNRPCLKLLGDTCHLREA